MLNEMGTEAKVVDVFDNNAIDKEVHDYRPTHVIIEAFWVVPEKFEILKKLHPNVTWIVREHSDFPFLATEGIAFKWMFEYVKMGVLIGSNKPSVVDSISNLLDADVLYLPNYYPVTKRKFEKRQREFLAPDAHKGKHVINIGCFGAIRPLKNQLQQAIAAIEFADQHDCCLHFYMNVARVETCGAQVIKNIRALFENQPHHKLIEIHWLSHRDFQRLLRHKIDVAMQVSFSETFNIVSADAVNCNVPVVVSDEVYWLPSACKANPNDIEDIVYTLNGACTYRNMMVKKNKNALVRYNRKAKDVWYEFVNGERRNPGWIECLFGIRRDE